MATGTTTPARTQTPSTQQQHHQQQQRQAPRTDHTEGTLARLIEEQTAKLPSDLFLWGAGASILGSLMLKNAGRDNLSLFVGQWAPTLLILGLYNKLVKVAGSDPIQPDRHA